MTAPQNAEIRIGRGTTEEGLPAHLIFLRVIDLKTSKVVGLSAVLEPEWKALEGWRIRIRLEPESAN